VVAWQQKFLHFFSEDLIRYGNLQWFPSPGANNILAPIFSARLSTRLVCFNHKIKNLFQSIIFLRPMFSYFGQKVQIEKVKLEYVESIENNENLLTKRKIHPCVKLLLKFVVFL